MLSRFANDHNEKMLLFHHYDEEVKISIFLLQNSSAIPSTVQSFSITLTLPTVKRLTFHLRSSTKRRFNKYESKVVPYSAYFIGHLFIGTSAKEWKRGNSPRLAKISPPSKKITKR